MDNVTPAFLEWLIASRSANQSSALRLLKLLNDHPEIPEVIKTSKTAQDLLAICFSLWRAAFLADRTATRKAAFAHAKEFLGKLIVDNAIGYPQDKNMREWTFNYYIDSATIHLIELSKRWTAIDAALNAGYLYVKGKTKPQRRWDRHQKAFEVALDCVEKDFKARASKTAPRKP